MSNYYNDNNFFDKGEIEHKLRKALLIVDNNKMYENTFTYNKKKWIILNMQR